MARFTLMESKDEQQLFNANQLALGKNYTHDLSLLATISVQAVKEDEEDEDEDEEEAGSEADDDDNDDDKDIVEFDENRRRAVTEALETRERSGDRACSRLRKQSFASGVITRPAVPAGLGRSSPLRNSWAAEDL